MSHQRSTLVAVMTITTNHTGHSPMHALSSWINVISADVYFAGMAIVSTMVNHKITHISLYTLSINPMSIDGRYFFKISIQIPMIPPVKVPHTIHTITFKPNEDPNGSANPSVGTSPGPYRWWKSNPKIISVRWWVPQ